MMKTMLFKNKNAFFIVLFFSLFGISMMVFNQKQHIIQKDEKAIIQTIVNEQLKDENQIMTTQSARPVYSPKKFVSIPTQKREDGNKEKETGIQNDTKNNDIMLPENNNKDLGSNNNWVEEFKKSPGYTDKMNALYEEYKKQVIAAGQTPVSFDLFEKRYLAMLAMQQNGGNRLPTPVKSPDTGKTDSSHDKEDSNKEIEGEGEGEGEKEKEKELIKTQQGTTSIQYPSTNTSIRSLRQ